MSGKRSTQSVHIKYVDKSDSSDSGSHSLPTSRSSDFNTSSSSLYTDVERRLGSRNSKNLTTLQERVQKLKHKGEFIQMRKRMLAHNLNQFVSVKNEIAKTVSKVPKKYRHQVSSKQKTDEQMRKYRLDRGLIGKSGQIDKTVQQI